MELSHAEDVVTLVVQKRESKPSVQLRSPFLNTFGSSSAEIDKPKRRMFKTVIFGLRVYPFRLEVDSEPTEEAQRYSMSSFRKVLSIVISKHLIFDPLLFLLIPYVFVTNVTEFVTYFEVYVYILMLLFNQAFIHVLIQ